MAAEYLNKFAKKIDKRQADQVLRRLDEKRRSGAIRTVDEFTTRLQELLYDLTSTTISPSLDVWPAEEGEVIDSETYNHMLDRVRDDFDAAFEEANNIDEVRQSQKAIMRDVVLKNIRRAVNELEAKVRLYESGYENDGPTDAAIETTFDTAGQNRTNRDSAFEPQTLFSDPRTGKIIEQNAFIEEVGDRLTLSKATDDEYRFKNIRQVFDTSFPQSKLRVELPTTSIYNIIDQTEKTYWIQSLLFETIQAYAKVKLELILPVEKDINYIEIEPITDRGMILELVEYEDGYHEAQTLWSEEVTFTAPIRLNFSRIPAKKIWLTFRNENGVEADFSYNSMDEPLSFQSIERTGEDGVKYLESVYSDLDSSIPSPTVKDIIGVIRSDSKQFSGYAYTFGVDNIRAGLTLYDRQAIFISAPVRVEDQIGHIYLETNETRPKASSPTATPELTSTTYDGSDSDFYFSSIEYFVIKRDYQVTYNINRTKSSSRFWFKNLKSEEKLLNTTKLPLIPFNKTRINHERLVLSEKSITTLTINDVGRTLLFTDRTVGNVKVYKNGQLLTHGSDWTDFTTTTGKTPNSGEPMTFKIKIENPLLGDIYTVTYTPMKSTTRGIPKTLSAFTGSGVDVVDMVGNLSVRYVGTNDIVFGDEIPKRSYSRVFLGIIIRNNSARNALSAAVEDIKLFVETKNGQ